MKAPIHDLLQLSERITVLPVIHGSGDCAFEVRRLMLEHVFDCLAVPLPPSFQEDVEAAVGWLPVPTVVVQRESGWSEAALFADDSELEDAAVRQASYVPVDPCQPVIAALRVAAEEHLPRAFVDLETDRFEAYSASLPDPYALKRVRLEKFAAALLPALGNLPPGQPQRRIAWMVDRLRQLELRYRSVLFVCSVLDWPALQHAYRQSVAELPEGDEVAATELYQAHPRSLVFLLGELPFITGLYERARSELEDDSNLSVDGVKELLIRSRARYRQEFRSRARRISPQHLATCLKYMRNLTLVDRRFTPDLYRIVIAAKQVLGDSFALQVAETARRYPYNRHTGLPVLTMGINEMRLDDGTLAQAVSRLPGIPVQWRSVQLTRRPDRSQQQRWQMGWNPFHQCSWPPEDQLIEDFRTHVADRARQIMGADLIRTEKFTTSVKDGIDIRDTLRNWHTGEIFVKVLPPAHGHLNAVVMLFDSPADPRDYPWRTTWFAEHQNESTLAFFATDYRANMVGPGIGLGQYGGALFLFPPTPIPNIWEDPRIDFTETLEERMLAAACLHSESPHIALLAPAPPGAGWRRLARRFRKKWVHVPMGQFGEERIQQLRQVHVLNGKHIRSFAAHFIRKP